MVTEAEKETEVSEKKEQTPIETEEVKTLRAQVESIQKEKERIDGGYKGLQRTLQETQAELKKRGDFDTRIQEINDRIELLATAIATGTQVEEAEEVSPSNRANVLKKLEKQRQEQEQKRKQLQEVASRNSLQSTIDGYRQRVEALGLSEDSDEYWQVYELVTTGDPMRLRRADRILKKVEESKNMPEKPKVTDEERIEKLALERVNKILIEKGLLKTEAATPSGSISSFAELQARYARGEISSAEYAEARKKEGIH